MDRIVMKDREYLIYEIQQKTVIDRIGIRMLEHNQIRGLMTFKFVHEEDRDYFRYDPGIECSLAEWLFQIRKKEEVLDMINSILAVYEEIPTYLLTQENLLTEITEIGVSDGKCLLAYVPAEVEKGNCITLIQKILRRIKYPLEEDYSYIFDLQNAFGRGDIKNIADIHKWIRIVNGEIEDPLAIADKNEQKQREIPWNGDEPEKEITPEPIVVELEKSESKEASSQVLQEEKNNAINDIFAEFGLPVSVKVPEKEKKEKAKKIKKDVSEGEKKKGIRLFGKKKEVQINTVPMPVQNTRIEDTVRSHIVINDLNRGSETVLMDDYISGVSLSLVRDKNRQEYPVREGENIIGSGKNADIKITDNSAISRKHARLLIKDGNYYLEDLGSTNGTCVNGEPLLPHSSCLITDMTHIKISNETFTFRAGR